MKFRLLMEYRRCHIDQYPVKFPPFGEEYGRCDSSAEYNQVRTLLGGNILCVRATSSAKKMAPHYHFTASPLMKLSSNWW